MLQFCYYLTPADSSLKTEIQNFFPFIAFEKDMYILYYRNSDLSRGFPEKFHLLR